MELHALHHHGWTVSALAREFGVSRVTIRRHLASTLPVRYQRTKPTELSASQMAHVERRLSFDKRTQLYARRRTSEGLSKKEILRCLKRYIAREVFTALPVPATLDMA